MEMAAFGLNRSPHRSRVFLLPLGHDVVVGLDFEQALKNQREALRGWFLQSQNLYVIVVEAKEAAMAFEMGFAEVVVEKCVVFQTGKRKLVRGKIEGLLKDPE